MSDEQTVVTQVEVTREADDVVVDATSEDGTLVLRWHLTPGAAVEFGHALVSRGYGVEPGDGSGPAGIEFGGAASVTITGCHFEAQPA